MLRLIKAGDIAKLQKLMRAHIAQTKDMYLSVLARLTAREPPALPPPARSNTARGRRRTVLPAH
jgi:hypothetical protein